MTNNIKNILLILVLVSCAAKNGKSTVKFFHRSNSAMEAFPPVKFSQILINST